MYVVLFFNKFSLTCPIWGRVRYSPGISRADSANLWAELPQAQQMKEQPVLFISSHSTIYFVRRNQEGDVLKEILKTRAYLCLLSCVWLPVPRIQTFSRSITKSEGFRFFFTFRRYIFLFVKGSHLGQPMWRSPQ